MKVTPELLKKYAKGQCSAKEAQAVEAWWQSSGESMENDQEVPIPPKLEERIWGNIQNETGEVGTRNLIGSWSNFWTVSIAATIVLFLGLATFLFFDADKTFKTGAGKIETVVLEDGTKVYLNSVSKLKVPREFESTQRVVFLEGEAYFDVAKDSKRPFIVSTKLSHTKVLGTKFNLNTYNNNSEKLTLKEGKVRFSLAHKNSGKAIVLSPNEQAVLENGTITKNAVDVEYFIGWMSNKLIFENETFSRIAKTLERKYDVTIKIQKENLKKEPFKGKFDDSSLDTILEDLGFVLKFDYKKDGSTIIIY